MSIRDRLFGQHVAEQAPLPPPIPWPSTPLTVERYFRCLDCEVTWQSTDPACWCCGQVTA